MDSDQSGQQAKEASVMQDCISERPAMPGPEAGIRLCRNVAEHRDHYRST